MSKIQDAKILKHLRKTEYGRRLGRNLILSKKDQLDLKTNYCGLCGKRKDPDECVRWFGELFHVECVRAADPNGIYDREIKGRKGFKASLK